MKRLLLTIFTALLLTAAVSAQQVSGAGGSSSVRTVTSSYTTTIPFSRLLTNLGRTINTGNITFTKSVTGAQPGYGAVVQVVADGTHTVDYSAFRETTGSSGYVNTSGVINVFVFLYDGTYYWVNIFQELNGTPLDIVAPTLSTATVENANKNKIVLTYNENLDTGSVPATTDFSASGGKTVTGVAVASTTVTLTLSGNYAYGDTITVSYTPGTNKIQDPSANAAASLSSRSVTNNILAPTPTDFPLVYLTNVTDNGDHTYTTGDGGVAGGGRAGYAFTGDFTLQMTFKAFTHSGGLTSPFMALNSADTNAFGYNTSTYWINDAGTTTYYYGETSSLHNSSVATADGDLVRYNRVGTTMTLDKSSDNGSNWTTLHTYTGVSGTLYGAFFVQSQTHNGLSNTITSPKQVGGTLQLATLALTNLSNTTDNGDGTYTVANSLTGGGRAAVSFAGDFVLQFTVSYQSGKAIPFIGLNDNNSNGLAYGTTTYWAGNAGTTTYYYGETGTLHNSSVSVVDGDLMRYTRGGTYLTIQKSSDSGSTWTTLHVYTGVSGTLYPAFFGLNQTATGNSNTIRYPKQQGGS